MRKFFLSVIATLMFTACGGNYIEEYEKICNDAKEQISVAETPKEIGSVMKQFRKDIRSLNEEYADEAEKYKTAPSVETSSDYQIYKRRIKAYNSVGSKCAARKRELKGK